MWRVNLVRESRGESIRGREKARLPFLPPVSFPVIDVCSSVSVKSQGGGGKKCTHDAYNTYLWL
jgi:hypothetical protein